MKKVFVLFTIVLFAVSYSFAQGGTMKDATSISKFTAGNALSKSDVGFLSVVANGPEKSRGAAAVEVTVDKTKFTAGHVLTQAEADLLNQKSTAYAKSLKDVDSKTRGAVCYYLYCNSYGNCYYVYYYC
ncbi:MAG: hypothetical protein NTW54_03540 [Bacteroidetes bacterium]|nr:hypothetical protein [Bacteroidota bacterium]